MSTEDVAVEGCPICQRISGEDFREIVWREAHWVATSIFDVPGWILVSARRHAHGLWGLSDGEAASLGPLLRVLSATLKAVAGAERVHLVAQGEFALHFHCILMARGEGDIPVFDGAELARRAQALCDPAKAAEVVALAHASLEAARSGVDPHAERRD